MSLWIFGVLGAAGALFAFKMTYLFCTALVLPFTKGALYVSTSSVRINAFLDAVPMTKGAVLVDIGCGDGRALRAACRRYRIRGIGYELNPMAFLKARLLCCRRKEIEIRRRNFWKADLSAADVLFCYLFPDVMKPLAEKVKRELRPGARIVSCNFSLPGFAPERVLRPGGSLHNDPIYIYRME